MVPKLAADLAATVPFVVRLHEHGDRLAVAEGDRRLTYSELAEAVAVRAEEFAGARRLVLVTGSNELEAVVSYLAALHAGHAVMLVPGDDPAKLEGVVSRYDPDVVVARRGSAWSTVVRRGSSRHDLHPELALLLTTSGSTGSSKFVRLSHENLQSNAEAIADSLRIDEHDRAATTLPMHYCYGLSVVHSHLLRGAGLILTNHSVVDRCFWERFRALRGTTFAAVPYTFDLLERAGFADMAVPSLRYVTQAGGRLDPERVRRFAELGRRQGWELVVMYGQTEATARMASLPPELAAAHPGAIGVPIPGGSFEIAPLDGMPDGQGELVYRGPNVMLGYADGPSELSLGRTIDVLYTGDIARRTGEGLYEIVGRRSRFLKLFGLRIDLQEVERLLERRGIAAWCTGDDRGLVVAVAGGPSPHCERSIRDVVREHVGLPIGAVATVTFDHLPRLANGKPDYVAVQRRARASAGPAPAERAPAVRATPERATPERPPTVDVPRPVQQVFAEVLGRPDIPDDASFVSLGGDSLSYVEASVALEDALGQLPEGWHTMPVSRLASLAQRRRSFSRLETNIALRAAAIALIVGTHAGVVALKGGAHVLLAVAGFNFARFQLSTIVEQGRVQPLLASTARIAVPSVLWITAVAVMSGGYGVANVLLVNTHLGPDTWDASWRYWFVEALVHILAGVGLLLALPAARRAVRRYPFGSAAVVLAASLAVRFDLVGALPHDVRRIHTAENVLWLFALGWAIQRARTTPQRLAVSGVALVAVPGFAGNPQREAVVLAGLLVLVWAKTVPVPRVLARLVGTIAGASLYVYLTHWQVYPAFVAHGQALAGVVASLVVGVAVACVARRALHGRAPALRALRGERPRWWTTRGAVWGRAWVPGVRRRSTPTSPMPSEWQPPTTGGAWTPSSSSTC